jgi:hypothetical protein
MIYFTYQGRTLCSTAAVLILKISSKSSPSGFLSLRYEAVLEKCELVLPAKTYYPIMGDLGDAWRSAKCIHITSFVIIASKYYMSFEKAAFGILYCKVVALIAEGSCVANGYKYRDGKGIGI